MEKFGWYTLQLERPNFIEVRRPGQKNPADWKRHFTATSRDGISEIPVAPNAPGERTRMAGDPREKASGLRQTRLSHPGPLTGG